MNSDERINLCFRLISIDDFILKFIDKMLFKVCIRIGVIFLIPL
ncbi:hypothetical protein EPIR_2607 [Erwinia piriflorinigrans CFBP 5888]|uniref:Uncharacterized protein n=1 Tax=Erwinia piriflorinigrans CFBP 5888 TaxID=1161919 RepID=V5ZAP3_9GAMM|nr:hypothetical protein EPIR_2607 [Erwinia piriflorinigrans CFBP 5888]